MSLLTSKWFIALAILIVLLVILFFRGKKSVHHEITINASQQKVWSTLTEMDKYPEWNSVMELLDGEVKEGTTVKYRFTQDPENISEIPAKIIRVEP